MIREYKDFVADIIDAIDKVEFFVKGMKFEAFEKDVKTSFAVIRAFEIMGEVRHKLIHEYLRRSNSSTYH